MHNGWYIYRELTAGGVAGNFIVMPFEDVRQCCCGEVIGFAIELAFILQGQLIQQVNFQFNPIEKIVELYEALVKSEKEKVDMLQRLLNDKK